MKKLLFVVNVDWFFLSHRLPIARAAAQAGYEVHVATTLTDREEEMRAHGFVVHPLLIRRGSTGILGELRSIWRMATVFRQVRPDIAHLVTIKPVVFGGILARWLKVPGVLAAVPGLGFAFKAQGPAASMTRVLLAALYRAALGMRNTKVVFQNPDDRKVLASIAALRHDQCVLIRGSGVDLDAFRPRPLPPGPPLVVLAARLLADKGIREFIQAAEMLKARGVSARFCLVGGCDPENRANIPPQQLAAWNARKAVETWGRRNDMAQVLAQASIVVLPSYGEGMPKVLLEAAACGRAIVTTDVPGCRDAIEPHVTGLLVPAKDAHALGNAIAQLIEDPPSRDRMGRAGRDLAEREFSIDRVVETHLRLYRELLEAA